MILSFVAVGLALLTCNPSTKRVVILNLTDQQLAGSLPPSIGNLTYLTGINLSHNNFHGEIPQEMGRLRSLQHLNLSYNSFGGKIPINISHCTQLGSLSLDSNKLIGSIPDQLSSLVNLNILSVGLNNLTGTIPSWIGNFSSLMVLYLARNNFQGSIPNDLGRLTQLEKFIISVNNMSGMVPSSIFNISSISILSITQNQLHGELPQNTGITLPNLKFFACGRNNFTGAVPTSLSNISGLQILDLVRNSFTGLLPAEHFRRLPDAFGKLQKLVLLFLADNDFSGPIPLSIGNLTSLTNLHMDHNRFEKSIPQSLGNCKNLLDLDISSNSLAGAIPEGLFGLSSLSISLNLSNNSLSGSLPSEIGKLVHLTVLDVSGNNFSGEIPTTLGSCNMLQRLHLEANEFEGLIPQSLKDLKSMEEIDLSCNNFTGNIPEFLGKLAFLKQLNLSQNNFEGELPKEGVFSNASGLSIVGNDRLCGGIPQLLLPPCTRKKHHSSHRLLSQNVVIPTACAHAFIVALSCIVLARSIVKSSRGTTFSSKDWKSGVSYWELVQSTTRFSMENLIGSGSFGSVYKGIVPGEGTLVAIKVLNLQQQRASQRFIDECRALRSIRHRNLLKIIIACSSIDNNGNDFKSLVFEFMTNGSLDLWLHPRDDQQCQSNRLSLVHRLNIAIDVASALDYLHNYCETSIVHCDLKPNNILLDEDMVAHIGDFGLAKFLLESSESQTIYAGLKGTVGYIPPEYGIGGQVSLRGDVYSYGIVLLEIFTGKRPTDDMFGEGLSIHQYAAMAMPDHIMDIVDPSLLLESEDGDSGDGRDGNEIQERAIRRYGDGGAAQARRLEECLVCVMQTGLSCSAISPEDRLLMGVVVNKMKAIRDTYLTVIRRG